jgi:copper chaperone NosL
MKKLKTVTRVMLIVSALLMVITYYVPVWQILMWAPQYPEGLEMKIWLDNLTGDYKIISGLNHYIGMKHIEVDMFPEFGYMIYIVGFLIAVGLIAALVNRKFMAFTYAGLIALAGVAGMVDFYQWGYDYGHNLDPTAPIVVPGMAYQPPLIGTKQLLNFTAYSGPDVGGYVFLVSGLLAIGALVFEYYVWKKSRVMTAVVLVAGLCFSQCSVKPEPIAYGKDACHSCKMTMMDNKFGCEIISKKGKVYKFDDVNCLNRFRKAGGIADENVSSILITDFANPGTLVDVKNAWFVKSDEIKSPMGSGVAGFSRKEDIAKLNEDWVERSTRWDHVENN